MSSWVGAGILLSAATYLFAFSSNLVVITEYGKRYRMLMHLERQGSEKCSDLCRNRTSEMAGYFWGMLGVLLFSHTLNAIIFKLKFHAKEDPFKAAYFLPLIHLWRMMDVLWRTLSCKGLKDVTASKHMNGLFTILGTTFEAMPMLILQFNAYLVLSDGTGGVLSIGPDSNGGPGGVLPHMSTVFKVSLVATLLSAAYSGGTAVLSMTDNVRDFKTRANVAVSSGLFIMFGSLARCLTYTNIIVRVRQYFAFSRSVRSRARFHSSDVIPIVFLVSTITVYWLYYWLLQRPPGGLLKQRCHQLKRCLTCLVFGYMSIVVGPLYPMVCEARDRNELGSSGFQLRLFVLAAGNITVDLAVVLLAVLLGTLPMGYVLASLLAALGYMISLIWYICSDRLCGPPVVAAAVSFHAPRSGELEVSMYFDAREEMSGELDPDSVV